MHDHKHDLLLSTKLFAGLDRKSLAHIAEATTELTIPAGTVMARAGDSARDAWVILDGTVDVSIDGEVVATLGKDEIVGELSLLLHEPRQASVTAATEVRLLVIEPGRFDALLDEVPAISRHLVVALARRLRDADRRLHH